MNACRILDRLWEAEKSEPDIHLRSDYRQAYICVSLASRGEREPFIESSYRIYGKHPDLIWSTIVANRKAKLGWEYELWYDSNGAMNPDVIIPDYDPLIPRKPSRHASDFCNQRLSLRILPAA